MYGGFGNYHRCDAIAQITAAGTEALSQLADIPVVDCRGGLVFPCFVDMHTHLDKGHSWERSPNPDGTFSSAIATVGADAQKNWNADDVYPRRSMLPKVQLCPRYQSHPHPYR